MESGCVSTRSAICDRLSLSNLDLDAVKAIRDDTFLVYDGDRVKWTHDLGSLKKFLENVIGLSGKWSSPGGKSKKFTCSVLDLVVVWYHGKQKSLLFQGKDGVLLKELLVSVIQEPGEEMTSKVDCSTNFKPKARCDCSCETNFNEVIEDMKLSIEILQSRVDSLQSLANSNEYLPSDNNNINNDVICLQVELNDERVRNGKLESNVERLKEEIITLKAKIDGNPDKTAKLPPEDSCLSVNSANCDYIIINELKGTVKTKHRLHEESETKETKATRKKSSNSDNASLPDLNKRIQPKRDVSVTAGFQASSPDQWMSANSNKNNQMPNLNTKLSTQIPKWIGNLPLIEFSDQEESDRSMIINTQILCKEPTSAEPCVIEINDSPLSDKQRGSRREFQREASSSQNQSIPTIITRRLPQRRKYSFWQRKNSTMKEQTNRQQGFRLSHPRRQADWLQYLDLVHHILH